MQPLFSPNKCLPLIIYNIVEKANDANAMGGDLMQRNVGALDRAGRAALALLLLGFAWKKEGKLGVLGANAAGMLTSSALSGYCPLYKVFKINTVGKPA